MAQAVPFLIAAFAMSAVSQYIQYQDAKKKEKRVKQQLDLQKKIDTERLAAKKQRDDTVKLVKDHLDNRESLLDDYEKRLNDIDGERKKIIEDLSNNDEKLDKILKEKYDLKKGD